MAVGEELASCNNVVNEEGKEDMDTYKDISELTDDDIRGLEFDSEEQAIHFYKSFAEFHGFAMRKDDVRRDDDDKIVVRQLVCNRAGKNSKKEDCGKVLKSTTRTDCRARIRINLNVETGKWTIFAFESLHNHQLTPSHYVHLIPKYRRLSEYDKVLVDGLHKQGVRTCHILGFMLAQKGGHEGLGFCKKDLYNYLSNQERATIEGGDAFAALSYLQAKADNDPMFFSKFTTTEDGHLKNLFWSDSASRIDYECFGDVIAFDATYKKIRYNNPLVIFCGYNHHGETTIFGCALVSDETTDTYKWVLNAFLEAMYHKQPKGVVTDGDLAMREAIRDVFPNSLHRLCSWHFNQNAYENVKHPKFLEEFETLIYANYTADKFEIEWKRIVDDYDLSNHKWVKKAYEMKTMWASAYMREDFFCGIRTTSMCEGINSFIKMYVHSKINLVDFVQGFERAVKEYRNNELMSNFRTFYYEPVLRTKLEGFELEASKIFTRKKFNQVQNEIEYAITLNVIERSELGNIVTLKMNTFGNKNTTYVVCLDKVQNKFLCDCRLFERVGLPCAHIICAMRHEHMDRFPDSLICKRWTKSAKDDYISSMSSAECDDEKMFMFRRGTMSTALNSLYDISCKHPDDYKEAMEGINRLCEKIKKRRESNGKYKTNSSVISNPKKANNKGAPRKKKSSKKKRQCSHCNGPIHRKRNCPVLVDRDALHEDDEEGVDKNCGNKRKIKVVDVTHSKQENINKRTSKQIENEEIGQPNVNMSDAKIHTGIENTGGQNVTWNHGSAYVPNYFTSANGVPIQSVPIFPQFPPAVNFSSHSNIAMYPGRRSFPQYTPFLGVLEEVERSAKVASKRGV